MKFGTGCHPEPHDPRNYLVSHVALASYQSFDWNLGYDIEETLGFTLPEKNQGINPSCVGQGTSSYAYALNGIELLPFYGAQTVSTISELSAKSVYAPIALSSGGAFMGDAMRRMVGVGINKESDVPSYEHGQPGSPEFISDRSWMTIEIADKAKNYKSKQYRFVNETYSIEMIAQSIKLGHGCLLGVFIDDFVSWTTAFPNAPSRRMYSHLVYAGKAKMINGKPHIGIFNSWGKGIGQNGWQWLGPEYFMSGNVHSAGILMDEPNSIWVRMVDRNGQARIIPTYLLQTYRRLQEIGSRVDYSYDR